MILVRLLDIYSFIIIIRIFISWINPDPYNLVIRFLYSVTDPVLNPMRRIIPPIGGMIDISPMIVLLLIELIKQFIIKSIYF